MAATPSEQITGAAPRRASRSASPAPRTPRSLRAAGPSAPLATGMAGMPYARTPQYTSQTLPGLDVTSAGAMAPSMPWAPPALPEPGTTGTTGRGTRRTPRTGQSTGQTGANTALTPSVATLPDPAVWLIAHLTPAGGVQPLEGAGRPGAIRVSRPYGHLRSIRPVLPTSSLGSAVATGPVATSLSGTLGPTVDATPQRGRKRATPKAAPTIEAAPPSSHLPAPRPMPQIVSAVEIETDTGIFRVERPDSVLGHSDLAWALANLEAGEPDSLVPLPRRQLALLLTLLPTPADPEHPENDPVWGWAHRLRGPWERGPLHAKGKLGKLIAVDPDPTGHGNHRACFELLGTDDIVWALGVPCFQQGSYYELVPLKTGVGRWLSWPLSKTRAKGAAMERPEWEIARVVYRVGSPRWPLAGVIEPLGPMGVAG